MCVVFFNEVLWVVGLFKAIAICLHLFLTCCLLGIAPLSSLAYTALVFLTLGHKAVAHLYSGGGYLQGYCITAQFLRR